GGAKEQLSLWKGMQTSESGFCGNLWSGSYVYLYPTEYSTYAVEYNAEIEDILRLTTKPDGTKEYYVTDHLASLRVKLDSTGQVLIGNDYTPFGDLLNGQADRRLFNSREKDSEHNLYNNGVRKLDDNAGRFTSIDPLWENFRAWSPYQYGYNEPLSVTDPEGLQGARAYMVNAMDQSYYSPSPGGGGTGRRGGGGTGGLRSFNLGGTIRGAWKAVSSAKVRTSSSRSSGRGTSGSSSKGQGRSKSTSSSNKSGKGGSQSTNGGGSGGNGSGGNGQSSNMGSRQLGELEPIHQRGANKITQTELQKMSDRELMKTVIQPKDGQYLKVREGSNRLLDGNTRVNEMIFRMQQNNPNFTPTLRLPVQVLTP
ncbi:MAG: RHS repeat domain-containing protein, partial [Candidatus Kapaibacterium sp.]